MSAPGRAAERAAREARDHPVLDALARAGFVAYGVVYLLIGWLAAQLALPVGIVVGVLATIPATARARQALVDGLP